MNYRMFQRTYIKVYSIYTFLVGTKLTNRDAIINEHSKLLRLNSFLDELNILRVGGRLTNSLLTFNKKHPVIILASEKFCEIMV